MYKSIVPNFWYFDSGHFRCMILKVMQVVWLASGMGAKSKIEGVCTIMIDELPILNDVVFVADLKSNLINVGKLCDDNLMVMFTKNSCKVLKTVVVVSYVMLGLGIIVICLILILLVMFQKLTL